MKSKGGLLPVKVMAEEAEGVVVVLGQLAAELP